MEHFSFFELNTFEKTATVSGWKIEGNIITPYINPTIEGLKILHRFYNINPGSVFVKNENDYTLFQVTPRGRIRSYAVKNEIMQPLLEKGTVCGGCEILSYNGYRDREKRDWCQFSRSIANLQE